MSVVVNLLVGNVTSDNDKSQRACKKPIEHSACKKDYAWNPSTCACECDKGCGIG